MSSVHDSASQFGLRKQSFPPEAGWRLKNVRTTLAAALRRPVRLPLLLPILHCEGAAATSSKRGR
jgi:hypothetical protein